jgi:hypothetical protein
MFRDEKTAAHANAAEAEGAVDDITDDAERHEVFKKNGAVSFRTVGWPRATVIFLKVIFATGVLSIPTAMVSLGAVGGALNVVIWVSPFSFPEPGEEEGALSSREGGGRREEGRKEGGKEGGREGGKEGRREGGKEGRREGRNEGGRC